MVRVRFSVEVQYMRFDGSYERALVDSNFTHPFIGMLFLSLSFSLSLSLSTYPWRSFTNSLLACLLATSVDQRKPMGAIGCDSHQEGGIRCNPRGSVGVCTYLRASLHVGVVLVQPALTPSRPSIMTTVCQSPATTLSPSLTTTTRCSQTTTLQVRTRPAHLTVTRHLSITHRAGCFSSTETTLRTFTKRSL